MTMKLSVINVLFIIQILVHNIILHSVVFLTSHSTCIGKSMSVGNSICRDSENGSEYRESILYMNLFCKFNVFNIELQNSNITWIMYFPRLIDKMSSKVDCWSLVSPYWRMILQIDISEIMERKIEFIDGPYNGEFENYVFSYKRKKSPFWDLFLILQCS